MWHWLLIYLVCLHHPQVAWWREPKGVGSYSWWCSSASPCVHVPLPIQVTPCTPQQWSLKFSYPSWICQRFEPRFQAVFILINENIRILKGIIAALPLADKSIYHEVLDPCPMSKALPFLHSQQYTFVNHKISGIESVITFTSPYFWLWLSATSCQC